MRRSGSSRSPASATRRASIRVHIDRVVIDDGLLEPGEARHLDAALVEALRQILPGAVGDGRPSAPETPPRLTGGPVESFAAGLAHHIGGAIRAEVGERR